MATTITKQANGNVKIVYPDGRTVHVNPCANVTSKVVGYPTNIGIESNGVVHMIDWTTVASPIGGQAFTTKVGLAEILGVTYFFDKTQVTT